jgi:hypothetical protein
MLHFKAQKCNIRCYIGSCSLKIFFGIYSALTVTVTYKHQLSPIFSNRPVFYDESDSHLNSYLFLKGYGLLPFGDSKMSRLIVIIGVVLALSACTGSPSTPAVEQVSLVSPTATPSPATTSAPKKTTSIPSDTPTPTTVPPTGTPTPKPSLEDVLLANARHIHGAEDAPVTFIEFSDFK